MYSNMLYPLLVLCSFFTPLTQAVPVQLEARDVDAVTLANLEFFMEYSKASLCSANNVPPGGDLVKCRDGTCPKVEADKSTTLIEFQNIGYTDTTGFIATDGPRKLIVVSFRGSVSIRTFYEDAQFIFNDYQFPGCTGGCKVHYGFQEGYKVVKSLIQPVIDAAIQNYPGYTLIFTGHSLGGALATFAAGDFRQAGYKLTLYAYGSPMVGNIPYANFVTAQSGGNYRVTNLFDIVPKLPGYPLGYAHISPEYWITAPALTPVKTTDIKVSSGAQNLQGNQGTLITNPLDHITYFGPLGGCTNPDELIY